MFRIHARAQKHLHISHTHETRTSVCSDPQGPGIYESSDSQDSTSTLSSQRHTHVYKSTCITHVLRPQNPPRELRLTDVSESQVRVCVFRAGTYTTCTDLLRCRHTRARGRVNSGMCTSAPRLTEEHECHSSTPAYTWAQTYSRLHICSRTLRHTHPQRHILVYRRVCSC